MTSPSPTPTENEPGRRQITSIWLTATLSVVALMLTSIILFLVPPLKQFLKDLNTTLGAYTEFALDFSDWFRNRQGWVVVWMVPIAGPIIATQFFRMPPKGEVGKARRLFAASIIIFAFTTMLIALALALIIPMVQLIQSVSRPSK